MRRLILSAVLVLALSSCGSGESDPDGAAPASPATSEVLGDGGLPVGFDEPPDGEIRPDSALSAAELADLLRIEASDAAISTSCGPDQVAVEVNETDSAAGHRYGHLVLTNVSAVSCTVAGHPGLGARGEWGHAFQNEVGHQAPFSGKEPAGPVSLAPDEQAFADLEWTGELAGAQSEAISMLVLQLAQGQEAFGVTVNDVDSERHDGTIDIGIRTTVRVGPFGPLNGEPAAVEPGGATRPE